MHTTTSFVVRYGPLSGFGCWPFERHNGVLGRIKHNSNKSDIPSTLMRSWIGQSRLAALLDSPAPNSEESERRVYAEMQPVARNIRGTVTIDEASTFGRFYRLPADPEKPVQVDLEQEMVYDCLLDYVSTHHAEYSLQHYNNHTSTDPTLPSR
jgi:hypothetical protein